MQAKRKRADPGHGPHGAAAPEGCGRAQGCQHAPVLPGSHRQGAHEGRSERRAARPGALTERPSSDSLHSETSCLGGKPLPGSGADLIREAREIRAAQLEDVM